MLILIFGLLGGLRGGGYISRITCVIAMGTAAGIQAYFHDQPLIVGIIVAVGMLIGFAPGWGKYLNILSGNMKYAGEVEVKPIDWLTNKICGTPQTSAQFIRWCFVAMTLRGILFYPLFIALSFFNHDALLYGVGCLLMGVIYWLARYAPEGKQVRCAEVIYGGLLGGMIGVML